MFVISTSTGSLALEPGEGVTNNSVNLETLNVPIQLGGTVTLAANTLAGNLVLSQPVVDKVLFVENGLSPKLKVINIKIGAVEVDGMACLAAK